MKISVDIRATPNLRQAPFGNEGEPIYAVMLTGKHPDRAPLARNAILSFLTQTYPNRHLLIVNDGELRFDCPTLAGHGGRLIEINLREKMLLGDLRNCAFDRLPPNCVWIQWDDDDWHHPEAIATQYDLLCQRDLEACTLAAQVKYALRHNVAWEHRLPSGYPGFAGTVMARSCVGVRYPSMRCDEDSVFWAAVLKEHRADAVGSPAHHYIRFLHGNNTSKHLEFRGTARNEWNLSRAGEAYLKSVVPLYGATALEVDARVHLDRGPVVCA